MRITKVTTKTGDDGKTGLGDGQRITKNHPIINALGDLDHLNSIIGWAEAASSNKIYSQELKNIQQDIFNISGDISLPDRDTALLSMDRIDYLEEKIKEMSNDLPPLKNSYCPEEVNSILGCISQEPHAETVNDLLLLCIKIKKKMIFMQNI